MAFMAKDRGGILVSQFNLNSQAKIHLKRRFLSRKSDSFCRFPVQFLGQVFSPSAEIISSGPLTVLPLLGGSAIVQGCQWPYSSFRMLEA